MEGWQGIFLYLLSVGVRQVKDLAVGCSLVLSAKRESLDEVQGRAEVESYRMRGMCGEGGIGRRWDLPSCADVNEDHDPILSFATALLCRALTYLESIFNADHLYQRPTIF